MYRLIVILLLCSGSVQAESYFYIGLGVGKNAMLFDSENDWEDNGEIGCGAKFGYRHHLSGSFYGDLNYSHYSQCLSGPPVNDDWESSSDHAYYWVEYRF